MTIYIKYGKDPPNLPIAVADSAKELAQKTGMSVNSVYSMASRKSEIIAKIKLEETDEEK